ncbi:hypothetical protein [Niallia sp. NCCP-28]|uniref:hypothetical protein n=1 Tax=Niallia sp. NCCP-28 TaxID=2934712 RepID=UPI0020862746|nr:hypothetical protein [Niallia sp. NCCP-28]GKU82706.1 hypothetical protein NCCP28_21020 [Niallia sp. NCCP-28]
MIFSALDIIRKEKGILENRKGLDGAGYWERITNSFFCPCNLKHTVTFYVLEYLFLRSISFCEDISEELEEKFEKENLAKIVYEDFLEHFKKKNDLHEVYKKLTIRDLSPEHQFTLENIFEIKYSNFIDDYRKGLMKNRFEKII